MFEDDVVCDDCGCTFSIDDLEEGGVYHFDGADVIEAVCPACA